MKFSPDGALVAYDLPASDGEQRDVWVMSLNASRNIAVVQHPANDTVVGWTADGGLLFRSDRTGSPGLWALRFVNDRPEGVPTLVKAPLPVDVCTRRDAIWEPDLWPRDWWAGRKGGRVRPEDGQGSEVPRPVTEREPVPVQADWSPDGRRMVVRAREEGQEILSIVDLANGESRRLRVPFASINQVQWLTDTSIVVRASDMKGRWGLHRVDVSTGRADDD